MEYNAQRPMRVITLCSGYDSQCMALDRLKETFPGFDYELVAWAEIDKFACQAHDALYPQWADRNIGDITKVDWTTVPKCDLLTYSTPCQSVSIAGKMEGITEGSGTASAILWNCREAIRILRPRYLLQENVKGLVSKTFRPQFLLWQQGLEEMGYTNFYKVLDAKDYGVPQHRERIFAVSILDEHAKYHFPKKIPCTLCMKDMCEDDDEVDESYYLSDQRLENLRLFVPVEELYED